MFRIRDGKIKIFSKYVQMVYGTHTIYIDKDSGAISFVSGDPVVRYTLDEATGHLSIESLLSDLGLPYDAPTKARSWMNGRKLSAGPLYGSDISNTNEISVFAEGFAFDFNYTSIAHTVTAVKPFKWAGGRVCFDDMYSPGGSGQGVYTATPSSGSCGMALTDMYSSGEGSIRDIVALYGGGIGGGGYTAASFTNTMEFYANSTSVVFSYRSFRKYMSFARGVSGLFECSLGAIGGNDASVEPDGVIPDVFDSGFKFSMFSLSQ